MNIQNIVNCYHSGYVDLYILIKLLRMYLWTSHLRKIAIQYVLVPRSPIAPGGRRGDRKLLRDFSSGIFLRR